MTRAFKLRVGGVAAAGVLSAGIVAGCGGSSDTTSNAAATGSGGSSTQLALVAYSTPKKAYDALTTAFEQSSTGKGVAFGQSFGPSGSQSRAVASGQPADIVAFSTEPDISRLVKAELVSKNWDANSQKGMSSDSVV